MEIAVVEIILEAVVEASSATIMEEIIALEEADFSTMGVIMVETMGVIMVVHQVVASLTIATSKEIKTQATKTLTIQTKVTIFGVMLVQMCMLFCVPVIHL